MRCLFVYLATFILLAETEVDANPLVVSSKKPLLLEKKPMLLKGESEYWGTNDICYFNGNDKRFLDPVAGSYRTCTEKVCPRDDVGFYKGSTCHPCCYGREIKEDPVVNKEVKNNKKDKKDDPQWETVAIIAIITALAFMIGCVGLAFLSYRNSKLRGSAETITLLGGKKWFNRLKKKQNNNNNVNRVSNDKENGDNENKKTEQPIAQDHFNEIVVITQDNNSVSSSLATQDSGNISNVDIVLQNQI